MGRAVFPLSCLTWDQTVVGVIKLMAISFKMSCAHTVYSEPLTLQQAIVDPRLHPRLLDTHRQVWVKSVYAIQKSVLSPV